jgi:hypothetical protein
MPDGGVPLRDDDEPRPPRPPTEPVPVSAPQEDGSGFQQPPAPRGHGPENGLERFLWIHPCTSYFTHLAQLQRVEEGAAARVAALRKQDGGLYRVCVWIDLLFTFLASFALLATAVFLVWVTIWQPHLGP